MLHDSGSMRVGVNASGCGCTAGCIAGQGGQKLYGGGPCVWVCIQAGTKKCRAWEGERSMALAPVDKCERKCERKRE
eukprot:351138-Chlamydomonas_euryale.AAC.4